MPSSPRQGADQNDNYCSPDTPVVALPVVSKALTIRQAAARILRRMPLTSSLAALAKPGVDGGTS